MRVRCPNCGITYETSASPGALGIVDRCAQCGRSGLRIVREDTTETPPDDGADRS